MKKNAKVYVAGHRGLVGSALVRRLENAGFSRVMGLRRNELDLTRQEAVERFFQRERPDFVFLAAARVGGIYANATFPVDFIRTNLLIAANVIHAAYLAQVERLLFLGSSCIYPKLCPQPMKESHLLSGYLEPTNEPYAVAKIAGITMCRAYNRQYGTRFISAMPTNLYGPNDTFDLETSHVLPALVRKFIEARDAGKDEVEIWGSGAPRREFLHVDDLADACVFLMEHPDPPDLVNVGVGRDLTIAELAEMIAAIVGYGGSLRFDPAKPDGTPRKLLDVSLLSALGWKAGIGLREGIASTVAWYLQERSRGGAEGRNA